jgi:hypothetical protein
MQDFWKDSGDTKGDTKSDTVSYGGKESFVNH